MANNATATERMHFPLVFEEELVWVQKLPAAGWTAAHQAMLQGLRYAAGRVTVADPAWRAALLGAGEEKAVALLCDPQRQVFAVELIDERHYLNGRFVGGTYFATTRVSGLAEVPFQPGALIGLTFTGLVKAREFVYGHPWDRFQVRMRGPHWLDGIMTQWLQSWLRPQFQGYAARYKDVHGRNVLWELRPAWARGVPALMVNAAGQRQVVRVGLQPIDVR